MGAGAGLGSIAELGGHAAHPRRLGWTLYYFVVAFMGIVVVTDYCKFAFAVKFYTCGYYSVCNYFLNECLACFNNFCIYALNCFCYSADCINCFVCSN